MEPVLKQRLIGAAVVIALAVIFVPMVLDGSGNSATSSVAIDVPAPPTFAFPEPDATPPEAMPPIDTGARVVDEPGVGTDSGPGDGAQPGRETTASTQAPEPPLDGTPEVVDERAADDDQIPAELRGWVVQVGSFAEQANALELRQRLRDDGYRAFVEKVELSGTARYRVRVGPEIVRDSAQTLRARLRDEHDLPGYVTQHP